MAETHEEGDVFAMVDTWNDVNKVHTAIKMDVLDLASDPASLLMDLQVGSASMFRVAKDGDLWTSGAVLQFESGTVSIFSGTGGGGDVYIGGVGTIGTVPMAVSYTGPTLRQPNYLGWTSSSTINSTSDLRLYRDAANVLGLRNGLNPQTANLYNFYNDGDNYERGFLKWDSNVLKIGTESAGTGSSRAVHFATVNNILKTAGGFNYAIEAGSVVRYQKNLDILWSNSSNAHTGITSDVGISRAASGVLAITDGVSGNGGLTFSYGEVREAYTVSTLPTATVGMIARVTDASSPSVGSAVSGGGSSPALVWSNGTNWIVIGV